MRYKFVGWEPTREERERTTKNLLGFSLFIQENLPFLENYVDRYVEFLIVPFEQLEQIGIHAAAATDFRNVFIAKEAITDGMIYNIATHIWERRDSLQTFYTELAFLLIHELMHIFLRHQVVSRMIEERHPTLDPKARRELENIVMDFFIHKIMETLGFREVLERWFETYGIAYDPTGEKVKDKDEIQLFEEMLKQMQMSMQQVIVAGRGPGEGPGHGPGSGGSGDEQNEGGGGDRQNEGRGGQQQEQQLPRSVDGIILSDEQDSPVPQGVSQQFLDDLEKAIKDRGMDSSFLAPIKWRLRALREKPLKFLEYAIRSAKAHHGEKEYTVNRIDFRKFSRNARGPVPYEKKPLRPLTAGVIIDTSGSISNVELVGFANIIKDILPHVEQICLFFNDTAYKRICMPSTQIRLEDEVPRGGGSVFKDVLEDPAIKHGLVDILLFLSDFMIFVNEEPPAVPTIIIYSNKDGLRTFLQENPKWREIPRISLKNLLEGYQTLEVG